jgi:hypothetical protein
MRTVCHVVAQCEGEDLNLHGSNPASTSTQSEPKTAVVTVETAMNSLWETTTELLGAEARAVLQAAQRREPVERARVVAFARACLELTEMGRLALAVLDGGVFAPRRALELAAMVTAVPEAPDRKASVNRDHHTRRAERAVRGETVGSIPAAEVDAQIRRTIEGK